MESNTEQNICRACLTNKGSFQSVFLKKSSSRISINISEMLSACGTIHVKEGDGLPDLICSECSEKTVTMYLFKIKCKTSDKILRKRLKKRKTGNGAIKNKCDDIASNKNFIEDFKNDEFKCEIDEEMWEKKEEKISCEVLKEESKLKEFESDICRENINEIDLKANQEIVEDIKVEKIKILNEDIEIKYNLISPLLMQSLENSFPCPECDFVFFEKYSLDTHFSDLHIKKELKVSCNVKSKKKQRLVEINSLLENKPHGCDICFEGFSLKLELKEHMKTHTSTSTQTGKKTIISNVVCDKGFGKSFECDICEKKFRFPSSLRYHRRIHTGEKPYECEVCKKKFMQLANLMRHKKIHMDEKPFKCEMCKKKFSKLTSLNCHKILHTGDKPYGCDVCDKKYLSSNALVRHKKAHSGKLPFECKICKKEFTNSSGFIVHKRVHTGEKPYKCEVCKKTFSQLTSLNSHKRIHKGEKPFKCEICNKKFTDSSGLKIHKRIHTGEKPYECDFCKKKFSQLISMVTHKKLHTGEKPYECEVCKKKFITRGNLKKHKATGQCL